VPIGGCRVSQGRGPGRKQGGLPMKFRIYQHALSAVLAAYVLFQTFGAKWG
jgi:hypothetical protein